MKTAEATILRGEDAILTPLREALQDVAADEVDIHVHRRRAAGTHAIEVTEDAVANTRGVAAYAPATVAYLRALVLSDAGSGYAEDLGWRVAALDPAGVADRAIAKCGLDRDRRQLPPGDYEAVFEELAVAQIPRHVSLTRVGGAALRGGRALLSQSDGGAGAGR